MTRHSQFFFQRSSPHLPFYHFFQSNGEVQYSPFLKPSCRRWASQLPLKSSIISGLSLLIAFILTLQKFHTPFEYLFLGIVFFLSGTPALIHSVKSVCKLRINIDVLMTLAAFTSLFMDSGLEGGLLLVLFAFSEALGELIESKAKDSIKNLRHLSPEKANLILKDGKTAQVPVASIKVGQYILVKAGDIIPLDGVITEGTASLSLAHLTGEDIPQGKEVDNDVPSGAKVLEGTITVHVTKSQDKSTLTQIIELITSAEKSKPKLQSWIDRLGSRYATSIIVIAIIIFVLFPFILSIPFFGESGSLFRSLTFLVTASPCALIIGPPIVYLSALGNLASKGILIKGSAPLDALHACKRVIFDKTGTLTTGKFQCHGIFPLKKENFDQAKALSVAYALEKGNSHPLSQAITNYCSSFDFQPTHLTAFQKTPGFGVSAVISEDGEKAFFGNLKYIQSKLSAQDYEQLTEAIKPLQKDGFVISYLYYAGSVCYFTFKDSIREHAHETISLLQQKLGMQTTLLTGDHNENARSVATSLGIKEFFGELTPEQKLKMVQKFGANHPTAMVGDGVNDAPSLAWAHAGISMGKIGTITAIEASDVILLKDSLQHIYHTFSVAKRAHYAIIQNVTFALGVIVIASLVSLFGVIPLWLAVLLHEGSTVLVGLNGLRLLK